MVVPTLRAGGALAECLGALAAQTYGAFEVIVVDNSGEGLVRAQGVPAGVRVVENPRNLGFGAAVNQGWRASASPLVATLNDDARPGAGWLEALVDAIERHPEAGMCASKVLLDEPGLLDSAGMLIAADGSSKQRGHRQPAGRFDAEEEVLLPSASAALYRRSLLERTGGFDEDFFLYCEDTDLGLRARRAGWSCVYVPRAVVTHRYSHSAGRASSLKAYLVERNRLFLIVKNFPPAALAAAPWAALARYFWHAVYLLRGRGAAAEFRRGGAGGWRLGWLVARAHLALAANLLRLWRKRRAAARSAAIPAAEFRRLLSRFSIGLREVASL